MMRRPIRAAFAIAIAVGIALPLISLSRDIPELEVRAIPWLLPVGKVFRGHAPGQSFRFSADTLTRLDVALVEQPGDRDAGLELVLKDGGPGGEVLRRTPLDPTQRDGDFFRFDFEDVGDARGRRFHFELIPSGDADLSDWSPWASYRGKMGQARGWGDRFVEEPISLDFQSYHDDLQAIAVATDGLNVPAGECRLDLYRKDGSEVIREGRLAHASPVAAGYAVFTFPVIEESRGRWYTFRLTLPPGARMVGTEEGLSCMNFHGPGELDPNLVGMTLGAARFRDRDLIFRAWSERGLADNSRRLAERGGRARFFWIALLSIAANAAVLTFFLKRAGSSAKRPA